MPELAVHLWIDDRSDVVTYTVDGDLKRPGEAVRKAQERAAEDGHEDVNLKTVELAESAGVSPRA